MKVWIVSDNRGEGALHAVSSKAKVKALPGDLRIYGDADSALGKPFEVADVKVGSPLFITSVIPASVPSPARPPLAHHTHPAPSPPPSPRYSESLGFCTSIGGVFATKDAAFAAAGDLSPDLVEEGEQGEMGVHELKLA